MSLLTRAARNFSAQVMIFLITIADRLLLTGLLIRSWGVEDFSDWATILAATGLIAMADLGFNIHLGNALSRARERNCRRFFPRLIRFGLFFYVSLATVLLLGVGLVFAFGDLREWFNLQGRNPGLLFVLLSALQILKVSRSAFSVIYRGMGEYYRFTLADMRTMSLSFLAAVAVVALGGSPVTVAIAYILVEIIFGTAYTAIHAQRRYGQIRYRLERPSRQRWRRTARTLRWFGLYQILTYAMQNLPVLIIAWLGLSGPALVMFVVQRTLVNVARTVGVNLANATGVELSRIVESQDRTGYLTGLEILSRVNAALAALMATGLVTFGGQIVGAWTGRSDLGSITLLGLLLLPVIALAPASPLQMLSIYTDRIRPQAIALAVQTGIAIPGAILAGSHFGIVGVAGALALAEIIGIAVVAPALTSRSLGVPYLSLAATSLLVFLLAFSWSGATAWLALWMVHVAGLPGLALRLAAWGVVGALPVLWFGLPARVRKRLLIHAGLGR